MRWMSENVRTMCETAVAVPSHFKGFTVRVSIYPDGIISGIGSHRFQNRFQFSDSTPDVRCELYTAVPVSTACEKWLQRREKRRGRPPTTSAMNHEPSRQQS